MNGIRLRSAAAVLSLVGLAATGCDDRRALYQVRGQILTADGKPAAGASVILHPVAPQPGDERYKPAGTANAQGAFTLTTYTSGDGAPVGDYVATVEWRPAPKSPSDSPPDRLNGKFRDPASSPFKVTIEKRDNELPPIRLP